MSNASNTKGRIAAKLGRSALVPAVAVLLVALVAASPALAAKTHLFTGTSFGPDGTSATSFANVQSVAVDQANGDVYVYDGAAEKIYKFDSAGHPIDFSSLGGNAIEGIGGFFEKGTQQIAVAPLGAPGGTAGDIYVANNEEVKIYAESGAPIGELTGGEYCGVATDPEGHVFVGEYPVKVREFTPSANPVTILDQTGESTAELPEICNVAADGLGNVYATNFFGPNGGAVKLEGLQAAAASQLDPDTASLAVDPSTDDVYVIRLTESGGGSTGIAQYSSSGALVSVFGADRLAAPGNPAAGIAVTGTSGAVYVGNAVTQRIDVFGPLVTVAEVTPQAPTELTPSEARLNATVNPGEVAVEECRFEYGPTASYGSTTPCEGAIPTDGNDHPVSAALTGLSPDTIYHWRVVATNSNGPSESADQTFTTARPAFTGKATDIAGTRATLNGVVFPEGEAVSECFFEYGTDTSYGSTAPCEGTIPTDQGEHAVTAAVSHLTPDGTTYHFRLVINRGGVIEGADSSFATAETVITGGATASVPSTAMIEGTVNPEGTSLTGCSFEYGPTEAYGSSAPCAESPAGIGAGTSPVAVHADLTGLTSQATYHYRLTATNADGTVKGADRSFGAPLIESQQAHGITDTQARLEVGIDPDGLATTYHVEYGIDTSYGQSSAESEAGADGVVHALTTSVTGLEPDTIYHWRAVASNAQGVSRGVDRTFTTFATFSGDTTCPNQALRSGASAFLSDCRAYEMVSPAQKGGEVIPPEGAGGSCDDCLSGATTSVRFPMQSSSDGETVAYEGQPFSGGLASGPNEYLSHRATTGWETESLSSPIISGSYEALSSDLSRAVLFQGAPTLSPEAPTQGGQSFPNLYLRDKDGSLRPLVTVAPPHRSPLTERASGNLFRIVYSGANAGTASAPAFSHVVFAANDTLTAATATAPAPEDGGVATDGDGHPAHLNLYEWFDGQLRLVNVAPGDAATAPGAVLGSGFSLEPNINGVPDADNAISADGSRIFWSAEASGQVYVRIDGRETQEIKDHAGKFLVASADGSRVLLSDGCLYDLEAESCAYHLSAGNSGFEGILGAAEDLSRIYFVDTEALALPGEENANREHAETGKFNLYAWHEGTVAFIGALPGADNHQGPEGDDGVWRASPSTRLAQVSSDGRYLAFMSQASLTGYDNTVVGGGKCGLQVDSGACFEVFEYAADTGTLICPSCNPSGEQPLGPSNLSLVKNKEEGGIAQQPGNLTADSRGRLFFESQDALSPRDTNGNIQDVYEWEPEGVGSCSGSSSTYSHISAGCVSLISSGHSANDSMFLNATPSGDDVFFVTREQLLPRDKDELLDLYEARVGGGFEESANAPCTGEACKESVSGAPAQQSPGSSTFAGPGNLIPQIIPPPPPKAKTAAQIRAEKLAKALKACKQDKKKKKRHSCEASAQKKYGAAKAKKKVKKSSHHKGSH